MPVERHSDTGGGKKTALGGAQDSGFAQGPPGTPALPFYSGVPSRGRGETSGHNCIPTRTRQVGGK